MSKIASLKSFRKLDKKELKNITGGINTTPVNGSGCTAMCARRGHNLMEGGMSAQDAHNYVAACIVSCNNG
ncbi:bacteriocin [Tenacibaculum sp. MEBiC06402]|uniref:bacteriocin n=1 Tax=unclassified Tenacibaculum TaxID=2635139 RepID=UPI003B9B35FC